MTTDQPPTPHSDSVCPDCPKCGVHMRLFGIEPDKPGFEVHSFECPSCHHIETKPAEIK